MTDFHKKTPLKISRLQSSVKKDSFCIVEGLVLPSKRTRFADQKDPFYNAKGVLFRGLELSSFLDRLNVIIIETKI